MPLDLRETFNERFGRSAEILAIAPGRVNLIGGHLDYHEGRVLPLAIDRALTIYAARSPDSRVRLYSETMGLAVELDLHQSQRDSSVLGQYCQGAIAALAQDSPLTSGCDAFIGGDLPMGAGLSSSSALVVGFIAILAWLDGRRLDPLELARLGNDAEHWFGTTGGIMDHYVISHGREGKALLIDCRSLTHEYLPLPEGGWLVVAHTGTARHQPSTPFAQRRQEAEAGLRILQSVVPGVRTLRDATPELLEKHKAALLAEEPSGAVWRRCHHIVTELRRVEAAAKALVAGQLAEFGSLMKAAHLSLRDDYEVTNPNVDTMFDAAVLIPGCYGARMTGGGFGGCTVNLVAATQVEAFCSELSQRYRAASGLDPAIFAVEASDGLRVIELA